MKLSIACLLVAAAAPVTAFAPLMTGGNKASLVVLDGYLDELGALGPEEEVDEDDSREATKLAAEKLDRAGPGDWSDFVDFNEFDGGDGQMGVAGDGSGTKLEKFDMTQMVKSKEMSAKNAWGKTTGYADELIEKGVDGQRAQQLENWQNQQEVLRARKAQQNMAEQFETKTSVGEENQWDLSSFGIERNQDFDMDEVFGAVTPGSTIDGVIELKANMNQNAVHEMLIKNEYMGFADFRAAFTADTPPFWTIEPREGSLDKSGTNFILRFRPSSPTVVEGYLVIETEDFKKTYKLIGGTS